MKKVNVIPDTDIEKIIAYYTRNLSSNSPLTIVGLNDDRGFNFQKNILMYLKEYLTSESYPLQIIDCFSMFFNKTRHIDYFLKHNISLEEIKLIQQYGTENELEHAFGVRPPFLSEFSKMFTNHMTTKLKTNSTTEQTRLADAITTFPMPIIVYASGINDLMYELHINPFDLKKAYKTRSENPKYNYALSKCNKETITKVVDGHRRNFETFLTLNETADIYVLSAFLYGKMEHDYEKAFREAILIYNDLLYQACKEYNISYINSRILETTHQNTPITNYISKKPPQIIANEILKEIVHKLDHKEYTDIKIPNTLKTDNLSSLGIMEELSKDIERTQRAAMKNSGYLKQVALEKLEEHQRELEVLKKVYKRVK